MNQVARKKPGERVRIEILRAGQPLQLMAEVGLRPIPASPER
jgi:serine protease DegS